MNALDLLSPATFLAAAAFAASPALAAGSPAGGASSFRFEISIDPEAWGKFGFQYPATYVFAVGGVSPDWTVRQRAGGGSGGGSLEKKTAEDFFNGIEGARLDPAQGKLYVSVGFKGSPKFELELGGFGAVSFEGISKYYDRRRAAYTLSNDNWGCNAWAHPGAPWRGPTDDSSDNYQAAVHVCRSFRLPVSIAINSRSAGGDAVWRNMQEELDRPGADWEPAVHGWTHPKGEEYLKNGYRSEILGCREDILKHLNRIPYGQYVYEHILTFGYEDEEIQRTAAGEFLFLRGFNWLDNPKSNDYAPWNPKHRFYGIGGLNTKGYDRLLETREPKARFYAADVAEADAAFDEIYRSGGIFYALWHPDRFQNSVIYDPRPGIDGKEGSTLMQHLAHVADRKDVWYVANGWLYSYRFVAEHAVVAAAGGIPAGAGDAAPAKYGAPWIEAMREVHKRFTGKKGTFAQFGDSITITMAFWAPLSYGGKGAPGAVTEALDRVKGYQAKECWRDWKGPDFGNEGGMTIRWASENVDRWLAKLNPETAVILFGTNDLGPLDLDEYRAKTKEVVRKCLQNGTVVILSTIPPRHGIGEKARSFAGAVRGIAREMKVPLVDFFEEVLKRRPDDWDGALEKFRDYKDYEVPTLISRDGVHPSFPSKYQDDYSEEGLRSSGYTLRNYLVLLKYDEVIRRVLEPKNAG